MKVALLLWIIIGTTIAGIAMLVIVSVPELSKQAASLIPMFCGGAFALSLPISWLIAKKVEASTRAA